VNAPHPSSIRTPARGTAAARSMPARALAADTPLSLPSHRPSRTDLVRAHRRAG